MRLLSLLGFLDLPTFFAGHGYDTGATPLSESSGDDGEGGIGTAHIVAVLLLGLVTVGLMLWLSSSGTREKLRTAAPAALMTVVIAAPLGLWAASSGGSSEKPLIVERATNEKTGDPEFIVYLGEDDLNTLSTTKGRRTVRVECLGRDGQVLVAGRQRWPFVTERGFDYPHVHQAASLEQLQRADRCRLRGTRVRLVGDVQGSVKG